MHKPRNFGGSNHVGVLSISQAVSSARNPFENDEYVAGTSTNRNLFTYESFPENYSSPSQVF
jgi:hypothetical protein